MIFSRPPSQMFNLHSRPNRKSLGRKAVKAYSKLNAKKKNTAAASYLDDCFQPQRSKFKEASFGAILPCHALPVSVQLDAPNAQGSANET